MTAPALLIDTMSVFYRAHHALPPMTTSRGEPTAGLYGVSSLLLKLLRERAPSGVAFAFDDPAGSFRRALFDGYKAGRKPMPPELASQLGRLDELVAATAAPVFRAPGFEADDVLATLAAERTEPTLVVSGDRDLLQVARSHVTIVFIGRRGQDHVDYDEAAVTERFGVPPRCLPAYVALVGDASDDLPKVPGVGAKTAARWIARHGDVATLLAHYDEIEPARLRATVDAHRDQMLLVERLATLRTDVPLPDGPRVAAVDLDALARMFEALEFRSLLPRLEPLTRG